MKLQDVFDEFFKSSGDEKLKDPVNPTETSDEPNDGVANSAPPAVTASDPVMLQSGASELTLTGSGFIDGDVVTVNGTQRPAHVVDAQHIAVTLEQSDGAKRRPANGDRDRSEGRHGRALPHYRPMTVLFGRCHVMTRFRTHEEA